MHFVPAQPLSAGSRVARTNASMRCAIAESSTCSGRGHDEDAVTRRAVARTGGSEIAAVLAGRCGAGAMRVDVAPTNEPKA